MVHIILKKAMNIKFIKMYDTKYYTMGFVLFGWMANLHARYCVLH